MSKKFKTATPKRTTAVRLLLLFAIMLIVMSCAPPSVDNWVHHEGDDLDNPDIMYYVLAVRSEDGKPTGTSSTDSTDQCRLLLLDKTEKVDPHGKHLYAARTAAETIWDRCWDYLNSDKPTLVINKIPKEFADQMRIEIPEFIFDE